ncbi:MAG: hypothetical protein H6774_00265 [Pseudomonadales bacterium]|nr:hypothetical protein [Pseudomonadales bacterium]
MIRIEKQRDAHHPGVSPLLSEPTAFPFIDAFSQLRAPVVDPLRVIDRKDKLAVYREIYRLCSILYGVDISEPLNARDIEKIMETHKTLAKQLDKNIQHIITIVLISQFHLC